MPEKAHMTAKQLLEIAARANNVSEKDVHRLVAEVFRLRAKLRAMKTCAPAEPVAMAVAVAPPSDEALELQEHVERVVQQIDAGEYGAMCDVADELRGVLADVFAGGAG